MSTIWTSHMTEAELQDTVITAAEFHGWQVFHDRDSRTNRPGFPDLVLVRPPTVLFVELKSEKGRVRPEQQTWLDALEQCSDVASGLVRPSQLDALLRTLARPTTTKETSDEPSTDRTGNHSP